MCYLDKYINNKVIQDGIEKSTEDKYRSLLNMFFDYMKEIKNTDNELEILNSVTRLDMDDFRDYLLIEKHRAISTVNELIVIVKSFNHYLLDREIITNDFTKNMKQVKFNPKNEKIKAPIIKDAMIEKDYKNIISATYIKANGARNFEFNSARDRLILSFMASTGTRIQETLSIRMDMIEKQDENTYFINVSEEDVKNDMNKKTPLVGKCLKYFKEYLEQRKKLKNIVDSKYLFLSAKGKVVNKQNVNDLINKYCGYANINKKLSPHSFRHYFSAQGNAKGINPALINIIAGWKPQSMQDKYAFEGLKNNREAQVEACLKIQGCI